MEPPTNHQKNRSKHRDSTPGGVLDRLLCSGWEFDFFQAVWLLERTRPSRPSPASCEPAEDRPLMGTTGPVWKESLRFRPNVALGFPAADVSGVKASLDENGQQCFHLEQTFLGLYGVCTPLPLHYAVDVLRADDSAAVPLDRSSMAAASTEPLSTSSGSALRDFYDLFNHRLISFFYRSGIKYRYDRTFVLPQGDAITAYLLWLIGLPGKNEKSIQGIPAVRLLRYAGLLTQRPRSAAALECILRDFLENVPVSIRQNEGRWIALPASGTNSIGLANACLGVDLTVGEQVYDLNGTAAVCVGPMDWETYQTFLPDGQRYADTQTLVQLVSIDPMALALEVKLSAHQIPRMELRSDDSASRLGYTSWVRTDEMAETEVLFDATVDAPLAMDGTPPSNPVVDESSTSQRAPGHADFRSVRRDPVPELLKARE